MVKPMLPRFACLLLACLCLSALPARATVVVPVDLAELSASATAIARGHIVRIEARQTTGLRVERLITFEPAQYLKGNLGAAIQFRMPGGTLGRYRTITVGAPEFREGDEVVLFLGARDGDLPVVLGFHQGVYRIATDPATGERVVTPPVLQSLSALTATPTPIVRGDAARRPLTWTQFSDRVSAALAAPPPPTADPARRRAR